jgi:hypothetical protein
VRKASTSKTLKPRKSAAARASSPRAAKLYWCTTPDHDEDWFVIARTAPSARRYHENAEGYGRNTAEAEYVCDVPARFADDAPCWPSDAVLRACGAEFLRGDARIVRIAARTFGEGDVFANAAAEQGAIRRH